VTRASSAALTPADVRPDSQEMTVASTSTSARKVSFLEALIRCHLPHEPFHKQRMADCHPMRNFMLY